MKTGLTTSVVMHAALIGFGLFTLSAPRGYEVADIEALPVDIVPVESITQIQKGDREAPKADKPAPKPTTRPDIVEDAKEVGDNEADLETPPTPEAKPRPVETASLPPPSPKPEPTPAREPEPEKPAEAEPDPEPVPATEVEPEPQPRQEVKPDPAPETAVAETPDAESVKLPQTAPAPEARPQPSKAQTAKAPERKDAEKPKVAEAAPQKSPKKEEKVLDDVAALLNKMQPSGGGAQRSTQEASLGGRNETAGAQKLTQSEMDALRGQLSNCWSIPVGAQDASGLRASVRFSVDTSGRLDGFPVVEASSGNTQFDESAVRAIQKCDRAGLTLPAGKEELWAEIVVNFDPAEMF